MLRTISSDKLEKLVRVFVFFDKIYDQLLKQYYKSQKSECFCFADLYQFRQVKVWPFVQNIGNIDQSTLCTVPDND